MTERIPHPAWVRPSSWSLNDIAGGCLKRPVSDIDVTADSGTLGNPQLEITVRCPKYPKGGIMRLPFLLMDAADTNKEQTQLGVDTTKHAVDNMCENCEYRVV